MYASFFKPYITCLSITALLLGSLYSISPVVYAMDAKSAPDYSAVTLDGQPVSLDNYQGQVILLNAWATWCEPCREEMPQLQALQNEFADKDFKVIGVSIDDAGAGNRIKGFLQSLGISYAIWLDPGNRFELAFRTIGTPATFLISRDGYLLQEWKGQFDPMSADTKSMVQNALAMGPVSSADSNFGAGAVEKSTLSVGIAFLAGILSFFSPCVLPIIPAFLAYLSGTTFDELKKNKRRARSRIFFNTVFFVLGFGLVFSLLGVLLSTLLASTAVALKVWLARIGGIVIIAFGLYLLGIIKASFLDAEHKFVPRGFRPGYPTSFIFGVAFAAGWTPCIGPILGSILTLAVASPGSAFALLLTYSSGLAIPFLAVGLFTAQSTDFIQKLGPFLKYFNYLVGIFLIIIGVLILANMNLQTLILPFSWMRLR